MVSCIHLSRNALTDASDGITGDSKPYHADNENESPQIYALSI